MEVARDNRNVAGSARSLACLSRAPFRSLFRSAENQAEQNLQKLSGPKCPEHNRSLFIRLIVLRSELFFWPEEQRRG